MKKLAIYLIIISFLSIPCSFQKVTAQYTIPAKLGWWYEARFGMFIHFGSYSHLGHGEWAFFTEKWTKTDYQTEVSANFNPTSYSAGTIARLAKSAGMKYIVITAKHHEGFSMWQTSVQSFKDVNGLTMYDLPDFTEFNTRDVLQELKDSCDALGIKFCLYYSIIDWNHSSQQVNYSTYFSNMVSTAARTNYIIDMKAQISELITKYHPSIMWFDGDWLYNSGTPTLTSWWTKNDGIDLYNYVVGLDSTIVVNERVCRGFGLGDYECPEREVPDSPKSRPWETCQTMNTSWGYQSWDNSYKSPDSLIHELVRVVSRDGNYLLNIGPKGDGSLTAQTINILTDMGNWMNTYSESVYGATRSPYNSEPNWGYYTKKTDRLFAHVFVWPEYGLLKVPSLSNAINKIYLMNDPATILNYTDSNGFIRISLPVAAPNSINSVVVFDVDSIPTLSTEFIKVNSISIKSQFGLKTISMPGGTLQMIANIKPSNATDITFTWTSSNPEIASISSDGLLTAKSNGILTVIASANDESEVQGKIAVTVTGQVVAIPEFKNDLLISLFPNPVEGRIMNIEQSGTSALDIAIYNMNGQMLMNGKMQDKFLQFDITDLVSGVYFIKVSNTGSVVTHKFIRK